METKLVYLDTGYEFTIQRLSNKISHIIIMDKNIYSDEDGRSEEYWRKNGLLIPLNSDKNIKKLRKLLKNG